jgi:hypothetical protein
MWKRAWKADPDLPFVPQSTIIIYYLKLCFKRQDRLALPCIGTLCLEMSQSAICPLLKKAMRPFSNPERLHTSEECPIVRRTPQFPGGAVPPPLVAHPA